MTRVAHREERGFASASREHLEAELDKTRAELQRCQLVLSFTAEREKERERRQKELLTENVTLKIEATKVRVELEKTKQLLQESVKAHHAAVRQYLEQVSAHMLANAGTTQSGAAAAVQAPPSPQVTAGFSHPPQCVYRVPEQLDETIVWSAESCPQTPPMSGVVLGGAGTRIVGGDDGCTPDHLPSAAPHSGQRPAAAIGGTPHHLACSAAEPGPELWVGNCMAPKDCSVQEPGHGWVVSNCGTPNRLPGSVHELNQMGVGSMVPMQADHDWWYRGEVSDPAVRRLRPPPTDDCCALACPDLGGHRRAVSPAPH